MIEQDAKILLTEAVRLRAMARAILIALRESDALPNDVAYYITERDNPEYALELMENR